jgi:hypothetical protein
MTRKAVVSGTGNPLLAGIGDTKKREAPFNAKQTRFVNVDRDESLSNLGPGAYIVNDPMTKSASTGSFIPRGVRFDAAKHETPGPGQYYDDENDANWNKKSYNIIFSDIS